MNNKIKTMKNEFYTEAILGIMKESNGYVTSKQIDELGIHRMYLKFMSDKKLIKRVANGIYIDPTKKEDPYYIFSISTPNCVFSHMTALYLHGLVKNEPSKYNITIRRNYNNPRLSKEEIFRVNSDVYTTGLTTIASRDGIVKVYDKERCICDIIRSRQRFNLEDIKYAIRTYFSKGYNDLDKIEKYAEMFGMKKEIMDFINLVK